MFMGPPRPEMHPFWREHCPVRAVDLTHKPKWVNGEMLDECAECGDSPDGYDATQKRLRDIALLEAGVPPERDDHQPIPTITGMCLKCRKPVRDHPAVVNQVDPPPLMERKMATGVVTGPKTIWYRGREISAPGRGDLSPEWIHWALKQDWEHGL